MNSSGFIRPIQLTLSEFWILGRVVQQACQAVSQLVEAVFRWTGGASSVRNCQLSYQYSVYLPRNFHCEALRSYLYHIHTNKYLRRTRVDHMAIILQKSMRYDVMSQNPDICNWSDWDLIMYQHVIVWQVGMHSGPWSTSFRNQNQAYMGETWDLCS
jgi:hypothetical protein